MSQINVNHAASNAKQLVHAIDLVRTAANDAQNAVKNAPQAARDTFAALLPPAQDKSAKPANTPATESQVAPKSPALPEEAAPPAAPSAIAVPDAIPTSKADPTSKAEQSPQDALAQLTDQLAELRETLEKGEKPSDEQLEAIAQALGVVAEKLGLSLDTPLNGEQLAALASQTLPEKADLATQLGKALAPMVQTLLGDKTSSPARALGDKLSALLANFAEDTAPKAAGAALAQLGLTKHDATKLEPALQTALSKLLQAKPVADSGTPALAAPSLKLTQPSLTGKAADPTTPTAASTTATSANASAPEGNSSKPESPADNAGKDPQKSENSDKFTLAAKADSKVDNGPNPTQTGAQPPTRADAPATARVVPTSYQTNQQQINLPQIAFEMVRQAQHGNSRFQIRLDPAELGRIDVRLDIDKGGTVNARLVVDKAETLDLMQRDQRALQQALQQAGLDSSKTTLEFSLRQNNSGQQNPQNSPNQPADALSGSTTVVSDDTPPPSVQLYRGSLSASGVNIIA